MLVFVAFIAVSASAAFDDQHVKNTNCGTFLFWAFGFSTYGLCACACAMHVECARWAMVERDIPLTICILILLLLHISIMLCTVSKRKSNKNIYANESIASSV